MAFPIWLWRPEHQPKTPVLPENYRCCGCCGCTAKCCFTFDAIIGTIALVVLIGIMIFMIAAKPAVLPLLLKHPMFYVWVLGWVALYFALRTIQTLKPSYMQAFMIVFFVSEIISLALTWFLWDAELEAVRRQIYEYGKKHGEADDIPEPKSKAETMFSAVLGLIWPSFIMYQYYRYVRDRQLEIEQTQRLPEHLVTYRA
ncbi:unnamed protein product, partial [Mesorhabditis spiculigera]